MGKAGNSALARMSQEMISLMAGMNTHHYQAREMLSCTFGIEGGLGRKKLRKVKG